MLLVEVLVGASILTQFPDASFFTSDQMGSFRSALAFNWASNSYEPTATIVNASITTPNQKKIVMVVGNVVLVKDSNTSIPMCQLQDADIPSSILQISVGNTFIALLLQFATDQAYRIRTYYTSNCSFYKEHQRAAFTLSLLTDSFNLTGCNGDFQLVENEQQATGYTIAFGCPTSLRVAINLINQSYQVSNAGVITVINEIRTSVSAVTQLFDLATDANKQTGMIITINQQVLVSNSLSNTLYYLKLDDLTTNVLAGMSGATPINLKNQTISTDTRQITFLQLTNSGTIFAQIAFNTQQHRHIRLVEFSIDASGIIRSPVAVLNNSKIFDVKKLQNTEAGLMLFTSNTESVLTLQKSVGQTTYWYGDWTGQQTYQVYNFEIVRNAVLPVLATSVAQSLFIAEWPMPQLISKKSTLNRQLNYFNGAYYALNLLELGLNSPKLFVTKSKEAAVIARPTNVAIVSGSETQNFLAGQGVTISFQQANLLSGSLLTTGSTCGNYYLQFDSGAPLYVQFSFVSQTLRCSCWLALPTKPKSYSLLVIPADPDNNPTIVSDEVSFYISPNIFSTIKNAAIPQTTIRENQNFSLKLVIADQYGNFLEATEQICQRLSAKLVDVSKEASGAYYDQVGVFIRNETILFLNGFCVVNATSLKYGSYSFKLYLDNSSTPMGLNWNTGQSLIFKVYYWPEVFEFKPKQIGLLILFCLFAIVLVAGVPFALYWVVEGRQSYQQRQKEKKQAEADTSEPQTDSRSAVVQGQLEEPGVKKHVGLGEVKIRGTALMDERQKADEFGKLEPSDDQLKALLDFKTVPGLCYVDAAKQRIFLPSIETTGDHCRSLLIQLQHDKTDYDKQLKFWARLRLPSKLEVFQVQCLAKEQLSETNAIHGALQQQEFSHVVFAVCAQATKPATEAQTPDAGEDTNFAALRADLEKLKAMKPPRKYGALADAVYENAQGQPALIPPPYHGDKYLLFGAETEQ